MLFHRAPEPPASSAEVHLEFERVVERYHAKVFQLVYRYTGDYEEACDLTQDTFVRAFNAWTEFRGDSQVYTWLYRIALNLCHNQQKRLQRRYRMERWSLDATSDDEFEGSDSKATKCVTACARLCSNCQTITAPSSCCATLRA